MASSRTKTMLWVSAGRRECRGRDRVISRALISVISPPSIAVGSAADSAQMARVRALLTAGERRQPPPAPPLLETSFVGGDAPDVAAGYVPAFAGGRGDPGPGWVDAVGRHRANGV